MNKRGQFYLLAAIILIAVIVGFAAVSNYTKTRADVKVYDVGDELGIEGWKIEEFGVLTSGEDDVMLDFTSKFAGYTEENQIVFIYGNSEEIHVVSYEEALVGQISVQGTAISITEPTDTTTTILPEGENAIEVVVNGVTYVFNLKPGENFYYVISQELDGEIYSANG